MAMTEEEKKKKEENRKKILFALAILLGGMTPEEIGDAAEFEDLPEDVVKQAVVDFKKNEDVLVELLEEENLEQPVIQAAMAEVGKSSGNVVYVIANPGDGKTCRHCREWIGRKVSDGDPRYPSMKDWMDSGALHPNCRCSLHAVDEMDDVQQNAKDYLKRKQKRLKDQIDYSLSFNSGSVEGLVFN